MPLKITQKLAILIVLAAIFSAALIIRNKESGYYAFYNRDLVTAKNELARLGSEGDSTAAFFLGYINHEAAIAEFPVSAALRGVDGEDVAEYGETVWKSKNKNIRENLDQVSRTGVYAAAEKWYLKSVENGNIGAIAWYVKFKLERNTGASNCATALEILERLEAEARSIEPNIILGDMYLYGRYPCVNLDPIRAAFYYNRAGQIDHRINYKFDATYATMSSQQRQRFKTFLKTKPVKFGAATKLSYYLATLKQLK